jgi:hypothetical protein
VLGRTFSSCGKRPFILEGAERSKKMAGIAEIIACSKKSVKSNRQSLKGPNALSDERCGRWRAWGLGHAAPWHHCHIKERKTMRGRVENDPASDAFS